LLPFSKLFSGVIDALDGNSPVSKQYKFQNGLIRGVYLKGIQPSRRINRYKVSKAALVPGQVEVLNSGKAT
jgi:hypothetical protein